MTFEVIITQAFHQSVARQLIPIIEKKLTDVRTEMLESFDEPKTGRLYGRHRASAPGEPPARRTGRLAASISQPDVRAAAPGVVGRIVITAPYAGRLEFGRGIAPRPFIRPAIEEILRRRV